MAQWKPIISSCPSAHTRSHHTIFLPPPFSSSTSLYLCLSWGLYQITIDWQLRVFGCVPGWLIIITLRLRWRWGINMLLGDGESPSYYLLATYIKSKGLPRKPTSCVMLYAWSVLVCNVNSGHLLCCVADNNDQLLLVLIKPSTNLVIICEQSSCVVLML